MTDVTAQTNAAARRLLRTYYKLNENHVDDELYETNDSDILGYLETLDEMEAENETFTDDEFELLLNRVKTLKRYYAIKKALMSDCRQIYG